MPVLMIQVLEDSWTRNPEDGQKTFDSYSQSARSVQVPARYSEARRDSRFPHRSGYDV